VIYLCAADLGAYDASSPLLVIVPRYVEFFFEKERNWQHEMKKLPRPLARPPVSASTYAKFCEGEHWKTHWRTLHSLSAGELQASWDGSANIRFCLPWGPRRNVVAREKNTPHGFVGGVRAMEHKKTAADLQGGHGILTNEREV